MRVLGEINLGECDHNTKTNILKSLRVSDLLVLYGIPHERVINPLHDLLLVLPHSQRVHTAAPLLAYSPHYLMQFEHVLLEVA